MPEKTYTRPTGTQITVTDTPATREYAGQHGWVEAKPKRTRRKKKAE